MLARLSSWVQQVLQTYLQDCCRGNAVCEQVVELRSDLQNSCGRPLVDHVLCNDLDQSLPIRRRYGSLLRDLVAGSTQSASWSTKTRRVSLLLSMHRFVHQQCPSQVSSTLFRYPFFQSGAAFQTLLLSHTFQDALDFFHARRRDSDQQASTPDWSDDVACAVGEQNEAQVRTVLLHGATEGGLRIACEVVGFVDHDDLEALLGGKIDLLCLGDFFEEILDNDTVVVADI
jgi:hypothetical protein